jgi:hypothetical protein
MTRDEAELLRRAVEEYVRVSGTAAVQALALDNHGAAHYLFAEQDAGRKLLDNLPNPDDE